MTRRLGKLGSQAKQGLGFPPCSQNRTYTPEVLRYWVCRQTLPVLVFPKAPQAWEMEVGSRKGI